MLPVTRARLLAAVALLLGTVLVSAGPENQSLEELNKEARGYGSLINELFKGDTPYDARNDTHRKAIDFEARWVLYRIYDTTYHTPSASDAKDPSLNNKTITKIFKDYAGDLNRLSSNPKRTEEVSKEFNKAVILHAKEVLQLPQSKPIAIANAARALALLAELGQPELADALVELIKSPPQKNQGVQYWAFKGLSELQVRNPQALTDQRLTSVGQTLSAFIETPVTFPKEATEPDINGYRILRREAVRALARTRVPDYDEKSLPALTLLKVMTAAQSIQPSPDIDERVLAATGLARMRPGKSSTYNVDYAVEHIGYVAADLGTFAVADKLDANKYRGLPVREYASHLLEELDRLRSDSKDPYVGKAAGEIRVILEKVEAKSDQVNALALKDWLDKNKAPNRELFKGNTGSALKPLETPL